MQKMLAFLHWLFHNPTSNINITAHDFEEAVDNLTVKSPKFQDKKKDIDSKMLQDVLQSMDVFDQVHLVYHFGN